MNNVMKLSTCVSTPIFSCFIFHFVLRKCSSKRFHQVRFVFIQVRFRIFRVNFRKMHFSKNAFFEKCIFEKFCKFLAGSFSAVQVTARVPRRAPVLVPNSSNDCSVYALEFSEFRNFRNLRNFQNFWNFQFP